MARKSIFIPAMLLLLVPMLAGVAPTDGPIDIANRIEMFVDRALIDGLSGDARLKLHPPVKREIVLTLDQPWESSDSTYYTILRDGEKFRLYYRGVTTDDSSPQQTTCLAESTDGIHFTRPILNLHEWKGSKANNIVYVGPESAAFAPFLDSNPDAPPDERYKAVAYCVINRTGNVMALVSPDGIHWKRLQEEPILPPGSFDSLNTAHWDATAGVYRMYGRYWTGGHFKGMRGIQSSTSKDFRTWSAPKPNTYDDGVPIEEFYTNAVLPCPDAPHHLLSFPMRFIPGRKKIPSHPYPGVSDAVFMSSRDGIHWDRPFREAWVRPGLDKQNWTDRSNMPAWGIIETADGEFSMYLSEHYRWPDNRLRRMTVRKHGFASIGAGAAGGEILTKPIVVRGKHLVLNYATSAAGSVQVEVQDAETQQPIPGFALSDMPPLFGDEIAAPIAWKSDADLSSLIGKPVRFRFVLTDADIFSLQITD